MKKWEERRTKLLEELKKKKKLTAEEVKNLLGVSESTVRRIIIDLEQEHKLIRCFGGIQVIQMHAAEYSYAETEVKNIEEKRYIGEYAAHMVENGDVIYLSGGSTLKYMAISLKERIQSGELQMISIVTNSLVSAEVLAETANVIMPGGIYRKKYQDLAGSIAEKGLKNMCFNKAFIGTVAVSEAEGFMTSDIETASIMEVVLSKTAAVYVLADSGKIGKTSFTSYGKTNEVSAIITDSYLSQSLKDSMKSAGITIIYA